MDIMINCENVHGIMPVIFILAAIAVSMLIMFCPRLTRERLHAMRHHHYHSPVRIDPHEPESTLFGTDDDDEDD